jgi:hypothetical protein
MTRLRQRKRIARLGDELAGSLADSRSPVNLHTPARRRINHLTSQNAGRIVVNLKFRRTDTNELGRLKASWKIEEYHRGLK